MGEGRAPATAVEVDDVSLVAAGKNQAVIEGIAALRVEEADAPQQLKRVALGQQMTPQVSAGGIADPEFLDQAGIKQSALLKIP